MGRSRRARESGGAGDVERDMSVVLALNRLHDN